MDFNSYLTDFFSLLNNTGNIFGGNISGGAKPTGVTFKDGLSNAEIFDFYFDRSGVVPAGTKITIDTPGLKLKPGKEDEFINNQVEIVKYMLENSNVGVLSGGLFGGAGETKEELAAAVAAHLKSSDSGECSLLTKLKNNDDFDESDFNFINIDNFNNCFNKIEEYIMKFDIKERNSLRMDIFLLMKGTFNKIKKEDIKEFLIDMVLLLRGLTF